MKYHNFKRPLAVILASLLTFSSASFVASAQETGEENQGATTITYTFRGESSNDDGTGNYTVDVLANGGLINTGFVEITYDADLYSDVTFTPAANIKDASFYWDVKNTAGTYGVGFMSAANLSDGDAVLFDDVDNPSDSIAYIDASGTDDVRIGTFTLTFAEGNSYATAFTTANAEASAVTVKTAKYILHATDGYDTTQYDAEKDESTMLVFSAGDFTVEDTETTYNGNAQEPTVTSDVNADFTLDLNGAETQTNAGTYAIKVKDVSGEGYYDADEIDLAKNFVIKKKEVTITAPTADPAAEEYVPNGFDPADIILSSEDWKVTDTALLNVGVYNVNVKYVGTFDTDNNIYKFNEAEVTDKETIVATVAFEVTKAEGEIPALTTTYEATYDSTKDQTVTGYGVELSEGWEWVDANSALSIGDNKDIAVKFIPEDVANYTYAGYDAELGYVPGKVTVTLNKAEGTAPALPVVTASVRRDTLDTVIKASDLVTNAGVWSYTDAELATGDNTIAFTYKPADLDNVDYEGLANWNEETEQFEYSVTVKVLAPYFDPTGIYPPTNPAAVDFEEGKTFTAADFALANDWEYAEAFELTSAGTTEDVKVLYEIPVGYDGIDPAKTEYTVEDGNIVYYVDLTVNRIAIPNGAITFSQTSDYTGSAIALEKANIAITGLTGVTAADNVTLVAVAEVDAGTYDVLATVAETTNYNAVTTAVKIGTLTISPIDVTADKFTLEYKTVEYDGNAKMPTVTATAGVGAVATVKYYNNAGTEVAAPTDYGTYTVKVSGPANGNYKEYTDFEVGTFSITKHQVTITAPTALDPVNYVPGGYDLANLVVTGWTVVTTGKLNAGEHDVTIAYNGDFDTTNYSYIYNGEEVTDKAAITATLKLTVNKIAGTVTAPTATQTVTFDPAKGDKMASTYATFADGWSIAEDKALTYGANAITVEHAADTLNYTWDGYTVVGEEAVAGKITKVVDVTFEQKEITTTVPPVLVEGTNNKTFIEAGYKYSDFAIATEGWVYDTPNAEITSATTVNAKVKFEIGADYKLPAGSAWTVEGNYIVAEIALTVVPAELPADAAVATVTTATYDGSAKSVNVSAKADYTGLGEFTVSYEGNTNAGEYDVYVDFADGTNYKGGKITLTDYLVINKADVTKDMFTVADYEHKYDGNAKTANVTVKAEYAEIGTPTVTYNPAEVKAVGEYAIIVAGAETSNYNAYSNITLDTKLTIGKGKIVIQKPEVGYDVDYVEGGFDLSTVTIDGWTTISTQKVGAGKSSITVEYAGPFDTNNYEYEFDGAIVTYRPRAYPTIIVRKINLPADPLKIDDNDFTYNGSAQKATVSLKNTLTGVGTIAVTYKQGETVVADPTDAGTYDVTATFAEGENYLGGTITFTDALTITKQVLQNISAPTFNQTEAIVGDVISGDAGEGFTFVEAYTIEEGDNELKVTKTIAGSFAKNYDYTEAAAKVGLTVTIDETTGDVTLSKTFNVTGKYSTGKLNLTVNTNSLQTDDANTGDVTITILPEGGTAYDLTAEQFAENADVITVSDLVLTEGKYTITVKKQKYLAYVLTLNVTANSTIEEEITLVAGDIVGGAEGKEIFGDNIIDIDDFVIAIRAFDDASSGAVKSAADIDENNANNVTDLGFIKANFNKTTADNCTEDTTITNG